jgi:hypothetical protein
MKMRRYKRLYENLRRQAGDLGLSFSSYGTLDYRYMGGERFPTIRMASEDEGKYDRFLVVTSGFHGEELQGPLTFPPHLSSICRHAEEKGVGLIIFPCVNPAGFDKGERYGPEKVLKHQGSNDFLRYFRPDGSVVGMLDIDEENDLCLLSSDPLLLHIMNSRPEDERYQLMQETVFLHEAITDVMVQHGSKVRGLADIHQDHILKPFCNELYSYAYVFGNKADYIPTVKKVENLVDILRNANINSGYPEEGEWYSDENGILVRSDGSLEDFFYRSGVPYIVAVETTKAVPPATAREINRIWIEGMIDLVAGSDDR